MDLSKVRSQCTPSSSSKHLSAYSAGERFPSGKCYRTQLIIVVLFNYRYNPAHWKVEEVIASGKIGNVKSVHFEWLLVSTFHPRLSYMYHA